MELSVMSPVLNQMSLEESLAYLSSLGVDNETFLLAREIPLPLAIDVMENASTEGKIFLAKKLVEVIDADEKVADTEIALLNAVAHRLKIDSYFK